MVDIAEIDKIVFEATVVKNGAPGKKQQYNPSDKNQFTEKEKAERNGGNDPYQDLQTTKLKKSLSDSLNLQAVNQSIQYQEEDSYINPSNVSKVNQSGYNEMGLDMLQNVSILHGMSQNTSVNKSNGGVGTNDSNPYISKNSGVKGNYRKNHNYENINNSNILVDGGDGLQNFSVLQQSDTDQIIDQSLYDEQNQIHQKLSDT